jgi:hypothetical protein
MDGMNIKEYRTGVSPPRGLIFGEKLGGRRYADEESCHFLTRTSAENG